MRSEHESSGARVEPLPPEILVCVKAAGKSYTHIVVEPECCAGCGDAEPEFYLHGDPYCYSCASCDICQSPYCEDPSHE